MKEVFDYKKFERQRRRDFFLYFFIGLFIATVILIIFNYLASTILLYRIINSVIYAVFALFMVIHIANDIAGPKADEIEYYLRTYILNN